MRRKPEKGSNPAIQAGAKRSVWCGRFFNKRGAKRNKKEENMKKRTKPEGQSLETGKEKMPRWQQRLKIWLPGAARGMADALRRAWAWLRGRKRWQKWAIGCGGALAVTAAMLLILHLNGFVFDHKCQLPRAGSVYEVVYSDPDPKKGDIIHRALRRNEPTPQDRDYPWVLEDYEGEFTPAQGMGYNITALCEVEYLHIVNCIDESTGEDYRASQYKQLFTLMECRVIRVLAERPDKMKEPLETGDVITVFQRGNSKVQYFNTAPYKEGERAVLGILPTTYWTDRSPDQIRVYNSQYRAMHSVPVVIGEDGEETVKGFTGFLLRDSFQPLDPDRPALDQLGEFVQKNMDTLKFVIPY